MYIIALILALFGHVFSESGAAANRAILWGGNCNEGRPGEEQLKTQMLQAQNDVKRVVSLAGYSSTLLHDSNPSDPNGASKEKLLESIDAYINSKPKAGDKLLLSFETHGSQHPSHGICSNDGSYLEVAVLKPRLEALKKAGVKIAVLDASCYSGGSVSTLGDVACVLSSSMADRPAIGLSNPITGVSTALPQDGLVQVLSAKNLAQKEQAFLDDSPSLNDVYLYNLLFRNRGKRGEYLRSGGKTVFGDEYQIDSPPVASVVFPQSSAFSTLATIPKSLASSNVIVSDVMTTPNESGVRHSTGNVELDIENIKVPSRSSPDICLMESSLDQEFLKYKAAVDKIDLGSRLKAFCKMFVKQPCPLHDPDDAFRLLREKLSQARSQFSEYWHQKDLRDEASAKLYSTCPVAQIPEDLLPEHMRKALDSIVDDESFSGRVKSSYWSKDRTTLRIPIACGANAVGDDYWTHGVLTIAQNLDCKENQECRERLAKTLLPRLKAISDTAMAEMTPKRWEQVKAARTAMREATKKADRIELLYRSTLLDLLEPLNEVQAYSVIANTATNTAKSCGEFSL